MNHRPAPAANHAPAAPATPNRRGKPEFTVGFALAAVQRWWKWALPVGVVIAAAIAVPVYLTFEPQYEAAAYLEIRKNDPGILESKSIDRDAVNTHVQMIRSPRILRVVLGRDGVGTQREFRNATDKMTALADRLQVRSQSGSELYTVVYRGTSATGAQTVANEVVTTYLRILGEAVGKDYKDRISLLKAERAKRNTIVKDLHEQVKKMTMSLTGKDPFATTNQPDSNSLQAPLLNELQVKIVDLEMRRTMAETLLKSTERWASEAGVEGTAVPPSLVEEAVAEDLQVQTLDAQINRGKQELAGLLKTARDGAKSSHYQRKQKEINALERQLAQLKTELSAQKKREFESFNALDRKERLDTLRSDIAGFTSAIEDFKNKFKEELGELQQFNGETFELAALRSDYEREKEVLVRIDEKIESLETERPAPSPVRLWEEAKAPTAPVEQSPLKQLMFAIAGGLFAPFGLALAWEYLHQRITSAAQFTQQTHLPVISEVAALPTRAMSASRGKTPLRQQLGIRCFRESIDALRTALLLTESLERLQLIAVTSAVSEEGKTSVATQLAVSLARTSGMPTLLIDGDVRSPDIHDIYELEIGPGLVDVLEEKCSLDEAIVYHESCKLYVLPAGELNVNPHSLFNGPQFAKLLEQARGKFGYIVLDTPPVLPASEALVQAKFADACVMCARVEHSRTAQVAIAQERLSRAGVRVAGAALVGVPMNTYYRRYGGYYYGK